MDYIGEHGVEMEGLMDTTEAPASEAALQPDHDAIVTEEDEPAKVSTPLPEGLPAPK